MEFANPTWLWGLTGLLIPVGIHLLSRKEGRVVHIGSLRHLGESTTAQFKTLRLNEILLLLLRCLLLLLIVLWLAEMNFPSLTKSKSYWLVIEKGIEEIKIIKPLIDSLQQHGFESHILTESFPFIKDSSNLKPVHDYWALAEDLNSKNLDSIIIISYNRAENFRGERIGFPNKIKWINVEPTPQTRVIEATQISNDSIYVRKGNFNKEVTFFETEKTNSNLPLKEINITKQDTITISIVADEKYEYDAGIIKASLQAIQNSTPNKIIIKIDNEEKSEENNCDWLIWLSDKRVKKSKSKVIAFRNCTHQNLTLLMSATEASFECERIQNIEWVLTKRLTIDAVLKENFAVNLASIILPTSNKTLAANFDQRVMPEKMLWSALKSRALNLNSNKHIDQNYLILLALIILIAERMIAYKRNQ
jgi:hypothetical protein